jgi:hypothetical protein
MVRDARKRAPRHEGQAGLNPACSSAVRLSSDLSAGPCGGAQATAGTGTIAAPGRLDRIDSIGSLTEAQNAQSFHCYRSCRIVCGNTSIVTDQRARGRKARNQLQYCIKHHHRQRWQGDRHIDGNGKKRNSSRRRWRKGLRCADGSKRRQADGGGHSLSARNQTQIRDSRLSSPSCPRRGRTAAGRRSYRPRSRPGLPARSASRRRSGQVPSSRRDISRDSPA